MVYRIKKAERKRRPYLDRAMFIVLAYAEAKNISVNQAIKEIGGPAYSVEEANDGVLMVDDFIDGVEKNEQKIIEGIIKILHSFIGIGNSKNPREVLLVHAKRLEEVHKGQLLDLKNNMIDKKDCSLKDYLKTISLTTAIDVQMCGEMGGLAASKRIDYIEKAYFNMGIFGQLIDDVLDYFQEYLHKKAFADIKALRWRFPLVVARRKDKKIREKILGWKDDIDFIRKAKKELFKKENRGEMLKILKDYYTKSIDYTKKIKNNEVREFLLEFLKVYMEGMKEVLEK